MEDSHTARSRELGARLRNARETAGWASVEPLAQRLGWSPTVLSRLEAGKRTVRDVDVALILGCCAVAEQERGEILDLVNGGADGCWVRPHGDRSPESVPSVLFQHQTASTIICYDPTGIPALLQTSDYAEAELRGRFREDTQVMQHVGGRIEYRATVTKPDRPYIVCYLHETALRTLPVDDETRLSVFRHLKTLIDIRRVRVRVVPADHDRTLATGGFSLLRFIHCPPVVCRPCETVTLLLEGHHVRVYEHMLNTLDEIALSELDSTDLIVDLAGGPEAIAEIPAELIEEIVTEAKIAWTSA